MIDDRSSQAALIRGEVVHKRLRPVEHKLKYRVFSLLIDVDQLAATAAALKLFSLERFNLFSLSARQHGYRDERPVHEFAWDAVRRAGMQDEVTSVKMLFYPRILGFAFNPLTVYFGLDRSGKPRLMIYEVRNTFGENLTYVLPAGEDRGGVWTHSTGKRFYVSPFNDVEGTYTFHTTAPGEALTVGVALRTEGTPLLRTHFAGDAEPLTDRALLKAFFAYPLMTLKIVAGIHWEALRLWRKGLTLKDRPPPPPQRILFP